MLGSLLITLREGLEAALIVGIILAYLARTDNRQGFKPVWLGTSAAVLVSLIAGVIIYFTAGELSGRGEEIFEGIAMFIATGVLTWMIFWMRKQAIDIKAHLHAQIQSVLTSGSSLGLALLAFIAVVREGIETVLFLFAATRVAESAVSFTVGGILGLVIAIAIGYSIYKGTSRLNLRSFFNVTSLVLIIFAAGLLAHGIHEFHEAGVIPPIIEHVWDINNILPEKSTFGRFLTALVGYNGNPSLVEVVAYSIFLLLALWSYFRPVATVKEAKAIKH
ncbi:MAG: FTR1 family protein [Chloroflexi bacterium]|nr:FTR1 family protein [Chloroflexota bacterium]MBI2979409.1 FTR1 family protein [Chloroflexota bacterium]